jgi:DNA-binding beta-propeller fold protein YncE
MIRRSASLFLSLVLALLAILPAPGQPKKEKPAPFNIDPPRIASDRSVRYDYDIVYVRSPRWVEENGRKRPARWAEFGHPLAVTPGSDLMLLHPDGTEEVLVEGGKGAIQDPSVSFDGEWVYFARFHRATSGANSAGADLYKIHVKSRKVVQLTHQEFTPNTGAADWAKLKLPYGVYNLGPCPVPGGKVVFTSNRNGHVPPRGYPQVALQLFIMDDDGSNVEQIGHLNVAGALHPVILTDGRILFSSLESQALHQGIHWGIWSMHPDGTNWNPVVSALLRSGGAVSGFHFQAQLSDGHIVVERYYNQNQKGFGTLYRLPGSRPWGMPAFGPADLSDSRNKVEFLGGTGNRFYQNMPFTPQGMESLTPWIVWQDSPAYPAEPGNPRSPRIGKVTHPAGAPDNNLLVAWTLGPIGGSSGAVREFMGPTPIDSGLYLVKGGKATHAPGEMLLIKNDQKYNEHWPRPLVPYKRIYGVNEPKRPVHRNDGKQSPHLPEGTPFGLVGTSSLYKRESAPQGRIPEGSVTAEVPLKPGDTINSISRFRQILFGTNWAGQGSDAGVYKNSEIHAIRILIQEPLTDVTGHRRPLFGSHANERMRILGEIPVRKFPSLRAPLPKGARGVDGQPTDPDGNPDTSFLARIPADQSFTFQTIDKNGMALNMAQTWHQVRPGEVRNNCGGCHAHSQKPTPFEKTVAARPDYQVFDLSGRTPLVTSKEKDESGKQWDSEGQSGLRYVKGPLNVEYWRDIRPILDRSCVACHTKDREKPAGGLVLDDDDKNKLEPLQLVEGDEAPRIPVPATYRRLVSRRNHESRYMRRFQSRMSYLVWKIHGRRTDGWTNDTFPTPKDPQNPMAGLVWKGKPIPEYEKLLEKIRKGETEKVWLDIFVRNYCDIDYTGSAMPPPDAVKGTYKGPDGKPIKVPPLTDEDRRTVARWIDLGCPIDMDPQYDPRNPRSRSFGWMGDDQRPTLTLTYPAPGPNPPLTRILVGMHDAYTGLDRDSFEVVADFPLAGSQAGQNLASKFRPTSPGVWELRLDRPITDLPRGRLTVSVKDHQGNRSRIERTFSVASPKAKASSRAIPDYRPVPGWPQLPDKLRLGQVSAVATDTADRVYVFHRGKQPILVFDRDGKFLRSWGDGLVKTAHGLRIDHEGNVWVTDIGNHQVLKFDREGKLLLTLGKKGQPGTTPDRFDRPTDVAVAPSGEFYVADGYGNSRVVKFSKEGKYLREWGRRGTGPGEFHLPHAICLDARGRVLVGDRENNRVQVFDSDGKFLTQWRESGAPFGLFLHGDRLLVADGRAHWIRVLDLEGRPVGRWGERGKGPGQFLMPHALCVDSKGAVYVAEVTGQRVQKFVPSATR